MALGSRASSFDPNQYYRFTNLALGGEFSLDVDNPQTTAPNGSTSLSVSAQASGQIWQLLELNATGQYLISSAFLGARWKLDAVVNQRGDYAPQLRNYTTEYDQGWILAPSAGAGAGVAGNTTTWSIIPGFLAAGGSRGLALSVYDDSTRKPYLAPILPDSQVEQGGSHQRWLISAEGVTIDDPTFSSTHLPALATEAPTSPAGEPATVAPTATATAVVVTVVPTPAAGSDRLTGSLVAAAVVPSAVFVLTAAALLAYCCCRRWAGRRAGRRRAPDGDDGAYARGCARGGPPASPSAPSDVLETCPAGGAWAWAGAGGRSRSRLLELEARAAVPSCLSVLSSNLSGSLRSASWPPREDGAASGLASPLSAPPPAWARGRRSRHLALTIAAAAAGAAPYGTGQALLPSPLVPRSPWFLGGGDGTVVIGEDEDADADADADGGRVDGGEARRRSSLEMYIYDCMEMDERRIGQAI